MIDFTLVTRQSMDGSAPERSVHFLVDGQPLLDMLVAVSGGNTDFVGPLARGWDPMNEQSLPHLLLRAVPTQPESGRVLLYRCPTCGDIGCGAYGGRITRTQDRVIWHDFAYENGYDAAELVPGVGPFEMAAHAYEDMIQRAWASLTASGRVESL